MKRLKVIGKNAAVIEDLTAQEETDFNTQITGRIKPNLINKLSEYRYKKEVEGIVLNTISIQTDRDSRTNLIGAYIEAENDANYTLKWKTDNGFVDLNATQIKAITQAVRTHVQNCFTAESLVEIEINSGNITTTLQVESEFDSEYTTLVGG